MHIFAMPRRSRHEPAPEPREALPPRLPCICATLRRASRAVTQLYDEELRATGLRTTQFTLLQAMAMAGETTQGRLGDLLALDTTTLTRTLAPLRAEGLVEVRLGADRRERRVRLSASGLSRLEAARPAWERAQQRLRHAVGASPCDDLVGALTRLAGTARVA